MTLFPDVKPFPEPNPREHIGANMPPLEERIVGELNDALDAAGLTKRIAALAEKGADPKPCEDTDTAGRYGDFLKLCSAASKAVEEQREVLNRPLLTAQRNLKGRADAVKALLDEPVRLVKAALDKFIDAERQRAREEEERQERIRQAAIKAAEDEARRQRDEAAATRAAEADAAGEAAPPVPEPEPLPVFDFALTKVEQPVARGDYGARVGSKTVWKFRIPSIRKLPDAVLKHEKVQAAIEQVVGAQVRGGARKITGVEIYSEQVTSVR